MICHAVNGPPLRFVYYEIFQLEPDLTGFEPPGPPYLQ